MWIVVQEGSISRQGASTSLPPPCSPTSQNVDINATEEEEDKCWFGLGGWMLCRGVGGGAEMSHHS